MPSLSSEQKFLLSTVVIGFTAGLVAVALERLVHLLSHLAGTQQTFGLKAFLMGSAFILMAAFLAKKLRP